MDYNFDKDEHFIIVIESNGKVAKIDLEDDYMKNNENSKYDIRFVGYGIILGIILNLLIPTFWLTILAIIVLSLIICAIDSFFVKALSKKNKSVDKSKI